MQIEISRLTLQDKAAVFDLLQDPAVMRFLGPRRAMTAPEAENWLAAELQAPSRFAFRECENGELIGFCGVKSLDGKPDFGYFLRKAYWGKGLAKVMCHMAIARLEQEMTLADLHVFIATENTASHKIAAALGWQKIAPASNAHEEGWLYRIAT